MKPSEILSSIPRLSDMSADAIVDSPAFAMQCRLGDESAVLAAGAARPADVVRLSIMLEDEPHVLSLARSPRFRELDAIWDSRAEVPEPILLALVEKDAGDVLQLVENSVRRQLKLVGILSGDETSASLCLQVAGVVFTLTRTATVVSALGGIRNLDASHESIRSIPLRAATEYAAFALSPEDAAGLAVGDAVLVPEMGTVPARLVVDGRFAVDESGVARYDEGSLVHVFDAEARDVTLGDVLDAAEAPRAVEPKPSGPLRLAGGGRTLAVGRLGKLADQTALIVEAVGS